MTVAVSLDSPLDLTSVHSTGCYQMDAEHPPTDLAVGGVRIPPGTLVSAGRSPREHLYAMLQIGLLVMPSILDVGELRRDADIGQLTFELTAAPEHANYYSVLFRDPAVIVRAHHRSGGDHASNGGGVGPTRGIPRRSHAGGLAV
jgi:hypothetical protein